LFCNDEISAFINVNFLAMGVSEESKEIDLAHKIVDRESVPAIMVLRKGLYGEDEVLATIDLRDERNIDVEKLKGLLKDATREFRGRKVGDEEFI
jgi:hypothetical protein